MGHSGSETKTKSARAKLKSRLPIGNPTYVLRPDKGFWLLLRRHDGPRSPCWVHVAMLDQNMDPTWRPGPNMATGV